MKVFLILWLGHVLPLSLALSIGAVYFMKWFDRTRPRTRRPVIQAVLAENPRHSRGGVLLEIVENPGSQGETRVFRDSLEVTPLSYDKISRPFFPLTRLSVGSGLLHYLH